MKFFLGRGLLCAILIGVFSSSASGATPRQTEVGSEEERLRRPKKIEVPTPTETPIELPPEAPPPAAPVAGPTIHVKEVVVEGASILAKKEEERLTSGLIGRDVTLGDLKKVADSVTRWYRRRGYITSRAFVPAQTIEDGVVRITVIEAKVGEVRIEGNKHFSSRLLLKRFNAHPGEILQLAKLEENLSRLNAHPDRRVKAVLAPGAQPGTTDLILQVKDKRPLHANYGVDTLGTKTTGEIRQSLLVSHGNLTGHDDQITVRGLITEGGGLWGGALGYLFPVTPAGVTGTFDLSGVRSSLGGDLKNLLARGDAVTVSPGLIVPLARRRHDRGGGSGAASDSRSHAPGGVNGAASDSRSQWELESVYGFDFKRVRTRLDENTNSKDDLRVPHAGTNLLEEDSWGQGLFLQELRVGIGDFLGGSHAEDPAASRAKAGGSFVRWVVNAARLQQGPFGLQLLVRGSAQLTNHRLVPAEQFRLGGFDTVRGYPEGEFLADSGFQTTVELRTPLERLLPGSHGGNTFFPRLRRSLLLVGFWDFAEGFLKSPMAGEDADERLVGVGCGLRLRPTAESVLQADFGWGIGDADREKDRPRLHLICRIGF